MNSVLQQVTAAAELLESAERVLLYTGAGMSAECGVPTYRDEGGRWRNFEPFASRGLSPQDYANPPGFREHPELAWSFITQLRSTIAGAELHDGYPVMTRWLDRWDDAFLYTTNIDELHLRAGVPRDRIFQRYGSLWELQCLAPCRAVAWRDERVPLCEVDDESLHASGWPRCPFCGGGARPRGQMSHDPEFVEDAAEGARYEAFRARGEPDVAVVVGTMMWLSWPDGVTDRPRVIHINPNPETHAHYDDANDILITARASDALVAIDGALRLLDGDPRRGRA